MHQKDGCMRKNLPPSWGCKTLTGLFALWGKRFIWYVLYTAHLPPPRSVRLVLSGEVRFFFPVTGWENKGLAGERQQETVIAGAKINASFCIDLNTFNASSLL